MGFWDKVQSVQEKTSPPCTMIVAAAGGSSRMGGEDKLFAPLAGVPVLVRTLLAIDRATQVDEIIVAAHEDKLEQVAALCAAAGIHKRLRIVKGGETRTESVLAAALECHDRSRLIAVHDGARPLVRPEKIDELIRFGRQTNAVAPAVAVTDTIKVANENGLVCSTPDRRTLFAVQTPQVFDGAILRAALLSALQSGEILTDDCAAVERLGKQVYLTDGDRENIKITTPTDLAVAETFLRRREEEEA